MRTFFQLGVQLSVFISIAIFTVACSHSTTSSHIDPKNSILSEQQTFDVTVDGKDYKVSYDSSQAEEYRQILDFGNVVDLSLVDEFEFKQRLQIFAQLYVAGDLEKTANNSYQVKDTSYSYQIQKQGSTAYVISCQVSSGAGIEEDAILNGRNLSRFLATGYFQRDFFKQ